MIRTSLILTSTKLKNELTRLAMTRKSNGKNCAYKMLEVGFPDGETYEADLAAAKPETDV
jgi:hypothetical protein